MPDPVVQTDPTPQQTPPAAPAATTAPAPQPASQTPPPASPPAGGADDLRPDTVIEYVTRTGEKRYATIRDLVDRAESDGARISAEDLERLKTIERGLGGDPEAARKMLDMYVPGIASGQPQDKPMDPAEERIARLEELAKRGAAFADEVEEQRMTAGCAMLVEQWKEKVPWLAKHPEAGAIVYRRVAAENDMIRASGKNPKSLPRDEQLAIIARSMRSANMELASLAQIFGAQQPQPKPQAQSVQVQNDQHQPGVEPGVIPSRLYVDPATGRLVDRMAAQPGAAPGNGVIPSDVPNPTAVGGHVAGTVPVAKQPITRDQAIALMRARTAEMNTQ